MRAENWQTVKELLQDVLQIEPRRRGEFLKTNGASGEVLSEVESLLALADESEDFMSLTLDDYSKDFVAEQEISPIGQRIGIYETEKEIGCGGMGAVYLAKRCDGKFEQRVAIKMLKREFNVERIRRSFRRESEIQSKLNHPHIARLLDAGTTADGVPYLVMEYVEGVPIDKFCESKNLPLNARLKLFNKVCEAVAFAHRNLIVHRDLKPSNILVTEKGDPKLLDFGISKLLEEESSGGRTLITLLGAMTPEYASPEQIKGAAVTTATDVYSLGVVLCKILTGALPYKFDGKTDGNLLKVIAEDEPTAPSAIQNSNREPEISNSENPPSAIRQPQLRGDLDNIILKCLAKEPARRYATVEQLSADLWRFIDGLPVLARSATFSYRAKKFYGRNRIPVLAGILILMSLITGIALALSQARAANAQANIADESRRLAEIETEKARSEEEKARAEKEKAEKITRFMTKIISYANPAWYAEGSKFGGDARVFDAVEDLSGKIDAEFAGEADVAAELHHKFTEVYLWVEDKSDPARAARLVQKRNFHARRALELRRQFYGERHELVAKDMFYALDCNGESDRENAETLLRAIEMMRETNPKNLNLPYMLESYTAHLMLPEYEDQHEAYRQAFLPPSENKYRIAERLLLESLPMFREHYKEKNPAIFENECKLAYAQLKQKKVAEAAPHLEICRATAAQFSDGNRKIFLPLVEEAATAANR